MITIEIKYKGKKYNDLESAVLKSAAEGMKEVVEKKLNQFQDKVKDEGGSVRVELTYTTIKDLKAEVVVKDISGELQQEIIDSMNS